MPITQERAREIIADFAREIAVKKTEGHPRETTRINFRNAIAEKRDSIIYNVPLELLRYRKENGRISSSLKTYERLYGPIDPCNGRDQIQLGSFLRDKDPEKADELKHLLYADGQREPGIITVDGFLINGNRRRVALEELRNQYPADDRFNTMRVVILPGEQDEGGAPTLKEIEQIENRYQLQTEGKADYFAFDAALSVRDKELSGYTLEQQMRDDPQYKRMDVPTFKRAVNKRRKDLLEPLECVDEYLETIGRPGEYSAVSKGASDPKGRWQAFIDLSQYFGYVAKTALGRDKLGVDEEEAGLIMQSAYAIIRMQSIPTFGKLHTIMRDLKKYTEHGKPHLLKIARDVKHALPDDETISPNGDPLPRDVTENKWINKYKTEITRNLVKAQEARETGSEKSAPVTLLEDALKKLNHPNMIVENIDIDDLQKSLQMADDICDRADKLKRQIYRRKKTASKHGMIASNNGK